MTLGRRLHPQGDRPADPPVRQVTIHELFADMTEAARQQAQKRQQFRQAGTRPPRRLHVWHYGTLRVRAATRSEARAVLKRLLGVERLDPGTHPMREVNP